MATKVRIEEIRGKIDFSQSAEPTLNNEQTKTGLGFFDYFAKAINWLKTKLGEKADDSQTIDYAASSIQLTPNQSYLLSVVLNTYGGNISKLFSDLDALGIKKAKEISLTGNSGTILQSEHLITNPRMALFYQDGEPIYVGVKILSNGNIQWNSTVTFVTADIVKIVIIG